MGIVGSVVICLRLLPHLAHILQGIVKAVHRVGLRTALQSIDIVVGECLQLGDISHVHLLFRHIDAVHDQLILHLKFQRTVVGARANLDIIVVLVEVFHAADAGKVSQFQRGECALHLLVFVIRHAGTRQGGVVGDVVVAQGIGVCPLVVVVGGIFGIVFKAHALLHDVRHVDVVDTGHTQQFHGAIRQRIVFHRSCLVCLTEGVEQSAHVQFAVAVVLPQHHAVGTQVGVVVAEVDASSVVLCPVVHDGRGEHTGLGGVECGGAVGCLCRWLHIDAATLAIVACGGIQLYQASAHQGTGFQTEGASAVECGVVAYDAVAHMGIVCHHGCAAITVGVRVFSVALVALAHCHAVLDKHAIHHGFPVPGIAFQ